MLIQLADWFTDRQGYLAMVCKTSTARKFLNHLQRIEAPLLRSALFAIPAKTFFDASVEACLLFCEFGLGQHTYDYAVYESLDSDIHAKVGHRFGMTVRDTITFDRLKQFYSPESGSWRSGLKHDCAGVMELHIDEDRLTNGFGEQVDIESTYLYPLIKGSSVANNRISTTSRFVIVPQSRVGESTDILKEKAPRTWQYLESHSFHLDKRKSRIYANRPKFSVFGVGGYTFEPWKVAICGLYKKLTFRVVGPINGKPVVFDDTVYLLGFETYEEAREAHELLISQMAQDFLLSLIFWDEKRPIKASVLNCLDLSKLRRLVFGR